MRCTWVVIGILGGLALAAAPQRNGQADVLFERAVQKETADGDLKGAIEMYRKLAGGGNRAVAAKALVRMGQCYEKLGDADARKAYERVVRDFADQKDAVAEAKAALGRGVQPGQQAARLLLTRHGNFSYNVAVSSDGRYLSFPDWETGDLVLHDVSTGSDRRLTDQASWEQPALAMAGSPLFSPDGMQVAYQWYSGKEGRSEIRVASLQTSALPSPLFDNEAVFYTSLDGWSPDGKWLVVTLHRKDRSRQIALMATRDGSLRVLKSGPEEEDMAVFGFSPDGNYIVYTRRTQGRGPRGYLMSVDGKSEVPLLSGLSSVVHALWTPDGSRVVFASDRGGSRGLWSIRVADGKPVGEPELLKTEFRHARPVGFARDGSLFYTLPDAQSNVYLAGLDSASGKLLSEPRRVNQRSIGGSRGRVAWLPDGESLSFWNRRNERNAFVVHTLATGEERDIPVQGSGDQPDCAGWFPDGRSYMSWQVKGQTHVFRRVDARTGEAQATWTIADVPLGNIAFSRDLATIFLSRKDGAVPCEREISYEAGPLCTYLMVARDLQTGREREIFRIRASFLIGQVISPDGRDVAFVAGNDEGTRSLMTAPVAGGTPRERYRGIFFTPLAWTGDGSHVLALNAFYGREAVYSFPAKGGPPEKFSLPAHMRGMSPAVSPDGTQIAFEGTVRNWQLWVMNGLLPETKPAAAH